MSDIRNKVLLYRTNASGVSAPADSIVYGELVMNYNANTPFLMFKDTNDEIVKIGGMSNELGDSEFHTVSQKGITDAFNLPEDYVSVEYPEVDNTQFIKTENGTVIYDAIKNIDQNISTLVQEVLNDEEVIAASITQLNESAGFDENCKYIKPLNSSIISAATSLYDADILLNDKVEGIEAYLNEIEIGISDNYSETEYPNLSNGTFEKVTSNDSLDEAIKKIENNIVDIANELKDSGKVDNVKFNDVDGIVDDNKVVNLEVDATNISLTETYESVVYPTITDGSIIFDAVSASSTIEDAIKQVDTSISKLVNEVLKDEKVIAAAITQLNESAGFDENCKYIPNQNSELLSGATSLSEVDFLLENSIISINEKFNNTIVNNGDGESFLSNDGTYKNIYHKLSNEYIEVEYPKVTDIDENGDEYLLFNKATIGQTLDEAVNTIETNISTLVQEVLKNEDVAAAAITQLNESSGFDKNCKYVPNQNSELLSGATSLNEADELLDNKINTLSEEISLVKDSINNIETLSNITINEKEGNVENGIASLTINGDEIKLSDSYVSVEYQYIDEDVNFIPIEKSMTVEKSIKQLDSNFSKLVDEVLKDEKIIAASITQLNESAGFDENCKYIVNENSNILRNATSLSDADNLLDTEILSIREQINNLSSNVSVDININGVYSELIDNITTVTISGNNIPLSSDYINVTYPSVPTTEFIPVSNEDDVESAIKKLDTSLSKLVQEVLDDEEVTSAALTEHNQSCGFNENGEYVPSPSANYISNALSLYEADIIVDNKIKELEDKILLLETQLESVLSRLSDLESANQV